MKLRLLTAEDLERALPLPVAIEAMKQAFAELSSGAAQMPQRLSIEVGETGGTTLVKPALTQDGLGAKLVSVFPTNRRRGLPVTAGVMIQLGRDTGIPIGLCDGTFLTALRTGAATGAATDLLAKSDAKIAALIGCGGQARLQALCLDTVRELDELRVFARTSEAVEKFAESIRPQVRARVVVASSAQAAVDGATVISTITTSPSPVFDGRGLAAGVHVNALGSFTAEMQEIDFATISGARVFVDARSSAAAEAGDLIQARNAGLTCEQDWVELGEVVLGKMPGRTAAAERTLFKSVGVAVQDVKAAGLAFDRAAAESLGRIVEL